MTLVHKTNQNLPRKHTLRIIAGSCRKSIIAVPDYKGLRPTPDRVRETLFNWLSHFWSGQFNDKSCLDLFAGSGALGFEAASRGMAHVQMVEKESLIVTHLRQTRDRLKLDTVRINPMDAMKILERMDASRYDLIFLDPPFRAGWIQKVTPYLPNILKTGALVYTECENTVKLGNTFTELRAGQAGQVHYQLHQYISNP